jgi:lipoprotein-releasing system permease protein
VNFELFVAKRIAFSGEKSFRASRPIIRIALAGVSLGFAVMIIAVSIVTGFKKEIREKVIGFGSHIQISNYDDNNSYETKPIERNQSFLKELSQDNEITHIQVFATKAGIIKTHDEIEGVVAKGISNDFDAHFFSSHMVSGKVFSMNKDVRSDSVLISENIAKKLGLKTGDFLIMHFIQQPPRVRKFIVSGIYNTGLEEFDNLYLFCDIRQIQKLNDWTENQVGGFEISIKNFSKLDDVAERVYSATGSQMNARTIKDIYPQIFDWLNLQNINAMIIIILMIIVSAMNMISALLIIILERINMIGTMKALGAENLSIRKVFIYLAAYLIGKGLLWGNIIGLSFIIIQKYFQVFHLDEQSYYLSFVPVNLNLLHISALNIGTLFICTMMMIVPTVIISTVRPIAALRYN